MIFGIRWPGLTVEVFQGNWITEKGLEQFGKHWYGRWVDPAVEILDLTHFTYENLKIDREVGEEDEVLKKKLGCK